MRYSFYTKENGGLLPKEFGGRKYDMADHDMTADILKAPFNFRVLVRHDEKYDVEVAHCIDTGSVVTSDSRDEALDMMKELLEDELSFALRNRNMKNLFSSPAPVEIRIQWAEAAEKDGTETRYLDVDLSQWEHLKIETKNAHLRNTIQFALAA